MSLRIPADRLRTIFARLVEYQDQGMSVATSRRKISQLFDITEYRLKQIEAEGITKQWPPLSEPNDQEKEAWARQQRLRNRSEASVAAAHPPTTSVVSLPFPPSTQPG